MDLNKLFELEQYFMTKAHDPSFDIKEKELFRDYGELVRTANGDLLRLTKLSKKFEVLQEIIVAHSDDSFCRACPDDWNLESFCSKGVEDKECCECWAESLEKFKETQE